MGQITNKRAARRETKWAGVEICEWRKSDEKAFYGSEKAYQKACPDRTAEEAVQL